MARNWKKIALALLTGALSLSLMACGGNGSGESETKTTESKSGEAKEISIFIPGYEEELWKGLYDAGIDSFMKENSNVTVKVVPAGWDEANTKIVSLIQAGDAPDVMVTGSRSLRQFAELGALEKLDSYMTPEFKAARVENVLNTANIDGSQYGIPLAFSSRALYYRTDLVPTPPTNWEELLNTAKEVKAANPDVYGFAIPTDITSGTDELLNFIYQNKGRMVNEKGEYTLNTPENIATLEYLKSFQDAGVIPDPVSTARSDQAKLFQNGQLAMFIDGPWSKKTIEPGKDKYPYATAVLPQGAVQAETLVTDSYSMSASSKHKAEAWALIEHMGKFEYQNAYDEAVGFFPILKEEEKDPRYTEAFMKPFADMIQHGVPEPHVPSWDNFNKEFVTAVQKTLTGNATAEEALKKAEENLKAN